MVTRSISISIWRKVGLKSKLTTVIYHGRQLVAETLAERGCRLEENIMPVQSCVDDFSL